MARTTFVRIKFVLTTLVLMSCGKTIMLLTKFVITITVVTKFV